MKEIPDYQTLMLPVLKCVADGNEHKIKDIIEKLANEGKISGFTTHEKIKKQFC
ncbi:winged helix-turn-helix domain-containing protein [Treponema pectinovorum]|uniref:winged helix-turn-helix domain-containing protein n=1 Tax=Treponema pectinovorum TaxID=164 RepID=UPI00164E0DFD|nr:winged helix-turn-helix domain-containing protein [Treponema pectinovorum]